MMLYVAAPFVCYRGHKCSKFSKILNDQLDRALNPYLCITMTTVISVDLIVVLA